MTGESRFNCPVCRHECRSNSVLCPECGVQFENWLRDNPDKSLPGWKLSVNPQSIPPVPVPEEASPGPSLTPGAREALAMEEMEKAAAKRNSPSARAGRKAGALMMTLAAGNITLAFILKSVGMASSDYALLIGAIDALVLGPLAIGTYMGKRKWGMRGIGYFALSTAVSVLLPGGTPANSEMDFGAITAASNAIGNGVVILILYWFINKMEK